MPVSYRKGQRIPRSQERQDDALNQNVRMDMMDLGAWSVFVHAVVYLTTNTTRGTVHECDICRLQFFF